MLARDELSLMLRPAGGGLLTVSTGRAAQAVLQRSLYGADDPDEIEALWHTALGSIASARVAILGVPSDCGAGLVRGASLGPQALREAMLAEAGYRSWAVRHGIVDVGDVAVVPHLLHDDMVSDAQKKSCRAALYAAAGPSGAAHLPVSPLSITERVIDNLLSLNPKLKLFVLGGDHSVAWPVVSALARRESEPWAIVQPDAHTDMLPERLGVRYCFGTWAYHANELLGRGGRLVQVGIRASRYGREHWESTFGVRQFWAAEVRARGEAATLDDIVAHLRGIGVRRVYFSNDIDATDAGLAPSTGAAEAAGLTSTFVQALVRRLGHEFDLIGADLMEVAPPIGSPDDSRRTIEVGASYIRASLRALVGEVAS